MVVPREPQIRVWPVVGSLFIVDLVASGLSGLLVAMMTPLGQFGSVASPRWVLVSYIVPLAVSVFVGAMLLPPVLWELAGIEIRAGGAAIVQLAGAIVSFTLRYAFVEIVLGDSHRFAKSAPAFLTGGMLLTWGASLAGVLVSVQLVRRYARSPHSHGDRYDTAPVVHVPSPVGIGAVSVGGLALLLLLGNVLSQHGSPSAAGGQRSVTGVSLATYATEFRNTEYLVFDVFNVVAAGPAPAMQALLRTDVNTLDARQYVVETLAAPNARASTAQKRFVRGLRAFRLSLPRIASLQTTRAQQQALLTAPGLRPMHTALRQIQAVLGELHAPGPAIFHESQWSVILRHRHP